MLFKATYDPEVLHLKQSLQSLELACQELRTRGLFLKLLEAVLKAGNRMNAGTARGNAQAFNLAALRKLSDVKSTDGKTTLLHFVVEEVVRSEGKRCVLNRNRSLQRRRDGGSSDSSTDQEEKEREFVMLGLPVVGGLSVEFANVKKAAVIDYDSFVTTCSTLEARVRDINGFLAGLPQADRGGGFLKEMKGFLEEVKEELKVVREEEKRVLEVVKRTFEYYQAGVSKDKAFRPLQLFAIVKDFLDMVDQVCIDIARNQQQQQKRKKMKNQAAVPSLGSPERRLPATFANLPPHFMASSESEDSF